MSDYYATHPTTMKQLNIVGVPRWHTAGFTGKGITFFHDDLGETGHNALCKSIIQTWLPDAKGLSGGIGTESDGKQITKCTVRCNETGESNVPFEEFIMKHDISLINNSTDGGKNNSESPLAKYMHEMIKKHNLIGTGAFGNFSTEPSNRYQGAFIMVSGIRLMADGTYQDYGVAGEACDFAMFMGPSGGTSYAAPAVLGFCGLLRSKYGRGLTQDQAYQYLREHCVDLGIPGRDPEWGWGLPILGDTKKVITLTTGSNILDVDGIPITMDTMPIIDGNNRMLVPVRPIGEALGCKVAAEFVSVGGKRQIKATLVES